MFLSLIPRLENDPYRAHVYLYSYFPSVKKGDSRPFVFRSTSDYFIVLSRIPPNCNHVDIKTRIQSGMSLGFSLICSPQRGISFKINGVRHKHKKRSLYTDHKEIGDWLSRRLDDSATVTYKTVHDMPALKLRSKAKTITMHQALIKGVLQVSDRAEFIERCTAGIGPKGWAGNGLLLMPEIMRDAMELSNAAA